MQKDDNVHNRLVLELKRGNYAAFDELFSLYSKKIFFYAKGFLKSKELSEDVVQSVFLTLWEKKGNIKDPGTFRSYLFTISYHCIIQHLKSQKKHLLFQVDEAERDELPDISTEEEIEYHLTKENIEKIVDTFPARCKEVFVLSRYYGLSHKEIAEELNISTKTIENQITKALFLLRKHMSKDQIATALFLTLFLS